MIRKRVRPGFRGWRAALAALLPVSAMLAVVVVSGPANAGISDYGTIHGYAGMCVDLQGNLEVAQDPIDLYKCNGTGAQNWFQDDSATNNLLQIEEDPTMCVDLYRESNVDGAQIVLWKCSDTDAAEQWVPRPGGALYNPVTGKCLDDPGFSQVPGTRLELWDCNGGANQNFTLAGS